MFKSFRISLVRQLVELNEKIIFNRKLIKFYKSIYNHQRLETVIDVGANLGQTIDLILKINPACTIFAFEPNPDLFDRLKKKYSKHNNIRLFQLGISDEPGEKVFYENVLHSTSSFEALNYDSGHLKTKSKVLGVTPETLIKKSYSVKVTTLSTFIETHCAGKAIDILKIDTEGHEFSCLLGLFKGASQNIRFIQLENHDDDMYVNAKPFEAIAGLLDQNDFIIKTKIRHGFGNFDDVIFEKK